MGIEGRVRGLRVDFDAQTRTYPARCQTPISQALRAAELLGDEPANEPLRQIARYLRQSEKQVGQYIDELVSFLELLRRVAGDTEAEAEEADDPVYLEEPMIGGEPVDEVLERMADLYRKQGRPLR